VIANSRATLNFPDNTSVAGNGSCNRFTGSVSIMGSAMKFGPLAATRMMCDQETSRQENDYLKALAKVERYEIQNRLTLYLYSKNSDQPLKFHAIL
jgi:heat shock protein HslJ